VFCCCFTITKPALSGTSAIATIRSITFTIRISASFFRPSRFEDAV
jgi:hypothetical protein